MAQSNANIIICNSQTTVYHIGDIVIHGFCVDAAEGFSLKLYDTDDTRKKDDSQIIFSASNLIQTTVFSGIELKCNTGILVEVNGTGKLIVYADRKFKV